MDLSWGLSCEQLLQWRVSIQMVLFESDSAKASAPSLRRRDDIPVSPKDFLMFIARSRLWIKSLEIVVNLNFTLETELSTGLWEIEGHGVDVRAWRSLAIMEQKIVPNPAEIATASLMSSQSITRDWSWTRFRNRKQSSNSAYDFVSYDPVETRLSGSQAERKHSEGTPEN